MRGELVAPYGVDEVYKRFDASDYRYIGCAEGQLVGGH